MHDLCFWGLMACSPCVCLPGPSMQALPGAHPQISLTSAITHLHPLHTAVPLPGLHPGEARVVSPGQAETTSWRQEQGPGKDLMQLGAEQCMPGSHVAITRRAHAWAACA